MRLHATIWPLKTRLLLQCYFVIRSLVHLCMLLQVSASATAPCSTCDLSLHHNQCFIHFSFEVTLGCLSKIKWHIYPDDIFLMFFRPEIKSFFEVFCFTSSYVLFKKKRWNLHIDFTTLIDHFCRLSLLTIKTQYNFQEMLDNLKYEHVQHSRLFWESLFQYSCINSACHRSNQSVTLLRCHRAGCSDSRLLYSGDRCLLSLSLQYSTDSL